MTIDQLIFNPAGRINRKPYWIAMGAVVAIEIVVVVLLRGIPALRMLVALAFVYPRICLGAKRLHDFNKTGWLQIAPLLIGGLVQVAAMSLPTPEGSEDLRGLTHKVALISSISTLVWALFYGWIGLPKGDAEKNRYGRPPQAGVRQSAATAFD